MNLDQAKQYCLRKCAEEINEGEAALARVYGKMYERLCDGEQTIEAGLERLEAYAAQPNTLTGVAKIVRANIPYMRYTLVE